MAPETGTASHLRITAPEPWVARFAPLVRSGGDVLDVACGGGRHARLFLERGHAVTLIDRNVDAVLDVAGHPRAEVMEFDLEQGRKWPLPDRAFAAVVVVNYLHRPLFPYLIQSLADGGVLIYDTFARGNERFNRPRNPHHLLKAGELLDTVRGAVGVHVVAYEHGIAADGSCPGVKQRICAVISRTPSARPDGEPEPRPLPPR